MNIPQIDGVDANTLSNLSKLTLVCLILMAVIVAVYAALAILSIYAQLTKDDGIIGRIALTFDNYKDAIYWIAIAISLAICSLALWLLATYFNYCY